MAKQSSPTEPFPNGTNDTITPSPPILFREMNKAGLEKGPFSYGIWSGNTFPSVDIQEVLQ